LVTCVDAHVSIELTGEHTRGATVVDLHGYLGRPVNAKVAVGLDVPAFWDRLEAALARLPVNGR
jgi:purine nucleosidase/pyrimidine-specific ribonucleoside hydrolase